MAYPLRPPFVPTPSHPKARRTIAPAEGERRAIGGYFPQYWLSASIILRELRKGQLVRLRVADPEAGRVDDLQIETAGRVDGFQVKWTEGTATFQSLLSPDGDNPPLLAQLADGWMRLRKRFPSLRSAVHLCSNAVPSNRDTLPTAEPFPERRHFAAFLNEIWWPLKNSSSMVLPQPDSPWEPVFRAMQSVTNLQNEDFCNFLNDLELDFFTVLPVRPVNPTRDEEKYFQDIEHLTSALFRIVADRSRIIELDRATLVSQLGWEARLEFKNKHELHVDLQHYEPIDSTISELERAVRMLHGGYLLLVGTPGSGKSSLLTLALRQEDVRLVRYYAFIPRGLNSDRGESVNFLHDVILSIEQDPQFQTGRGLGTFDRLHLLDRLRSQLARLNENFVNTGRKTVIVVDGLDHITREQRPDRSLLDDLLPPDEIPDGVLFVLGSQTDTVLPPQVQASVQAPERRIIVQALTRSAVFAILDRNERTSVLSLEQKELVAQLSGGHPLALHYLLNQLEADGADAAIVLASAQPYGASIEDQYRTYWPLVASHPDLVMLLGRLARLRRSFDLNWVERWAGEEPVNRLQTQIPHYFRRCRGKWSFFHNSFQQFLLAKTIERPHGEVDATKGKRIHRELAELFSGEPKNSPWRWEELYHRAESADLEWFDAHPTLDDVRGEFLNFRPIESIERDLRLALRAVALRQNPVSLVRLKLALKELSQREFHLENVSVVKPLLAVGERTLAFEQIRDGDRLRISPEAALGLAVSLYREGDREEARELFDLAQPLEMLSGERPVEVEHGNNQLEILRKWVRAGLVLRERTIGQIIESIYRLRLHDPHPFVGRTDDDLTEEAHAELLLTAGQELLREHRWEDLKQVLDSFDGGRLDWSFWLLNDAWEECHLVGDGDNASMFFGQAVERLSDDAGDEALLSIAEGYWRLHRNIERLREVFDRIKAPEPYTDTSPSNGFDPFLNRFRYGRLLYLLGEPHDPRELVPDPKDESSQGAVYILRALYHLARIAAEANLGQVKSWSVIHQRVSPLLRLFNQSGQRWHKWFGWHAAESRRGEFFALLVDVVSLHGEECLGGLKRAFEREWDHGDTAGYWPTDLQRKVVLKLQRKGVEKQWAVGRLTQQGEHLLHGRDASGRTEEYEAQAMAWLKLQEPDRSKQTIQNMLRFSSGVGYRKDYQFNTWIDWLGRTLSVEPDKALERIKWFARATVSLDETTEGKAARYAANKILVVVFRWSPRRGIAILIWLIEQHCLWFSDAISELLEAALDTPNPPVRWISIILQQIVLPTAGQGYSDIVAALLEASRRKGGRTAVKETAAYLLNSIDLRALPETRYEWKKCIAEQLARDGLMEPRIELGPPPGDSDTSSNANLRALKLRDGRDMSPADVLELVTSFDAFRELIDAEVSDSFFDWQPIVLRLLPKLHIRDLKTIARLVESKQHAAILLASISEEFLRRTDRDMAWAIGEQALAQSNRYGSRIAAFKALRAIDPVRTQPLFYHQLAEDEGGDAESLSELLPLLAPDAPISAVWQEIEQFCQGMFPEDTLPDSEPELLVDVLDDRVETAFADLILHLLTHPVGLLRERARKICFELIIFHDDSAQELIKIALGADDGQQEQALVVLSAAQARHPSILNPFLALVRNCAQSPQWLVRRMAQRLLRTAGEDIPVVARRQLPAIYELVLPERPDPPKALLPQPNPHEPIMQFGSAEELIAPFGRFLELVSERSGVEFRNISERAASLMQTVEPVARWSADAERALRSQLSSASLQMPFIRPRAAVARRAVFRVAAELVDAGRVSDSGLDLFQSLCAFYDDSLEGVNPLPRDYQIVPSMSLRDMAPAGDWVSIQASDFQALQTVTLDERIVVAQWCKLKKLDWGTPSELRESILRVSDQTASPLDDEGLFDQVLFARASSYSNEEVHESRGNLAVQNYVQAADTLGVRWLAFNPSLARFLGWRLSPQGLFRWSDSEGTTVAETLWWQDGTSEMAPPHLHSEVGFGWIVVVSMAGMEQIRRHASPLVRIERITRRAWEQVEGERRDIRSRVCQV